MLFYSLPQWHPTHINVNYTQSVDGARNFTTERVRIERVSYTTNGTYICTASNFGGSVERKIHIIVEGKKKFQFSNEPTPAGVSFLNVSFLQNPHHGRRPWPS